MPRVDAEITQLAAPADRCAIAPSSQKATCLFFTHLIHSKNSVLGGTAKSGSCRFCQLSINVTNFLSTICKITQIMVMFK